MFLLSLRKFIVRKCISTASTDSQESLRSTQTYKKEYLRNEMQLFSVAVVQFKIFTIFVPFCEFLVNIRTLPGVIQKLKDASKMKICWDFW